MVNLAWECIDNQCFRAPPLGELAAASTVAVAVAVAVATSVATAAALTAAAAAAAVLKLQDHHH